MTKITDEKGRTVAQGVEKFKDMVIRRLNDAGSDIKGTFQTETVLNHIIKISGGQPRELMTLIRDSLVTGGIPITRDAVSRTARNITHAYDRFLRKEHWKVINQVKKTHNLERTEKNDGLCMDLLDSRAVLQYRNEKQWYDANPLLPEPPKEK